MELDMTVIVSQEIRKKIKLHSASLTGREIEWTQVFLGRKKANVGKLKITMQYRVCWNN